MGGGLMQLVAYGAQDVYLTGNPQITFFKVVYRRHTNFSMECIEQPLDSSRFGGTHNVQVLRNGDLAGRMYLKTTLPALTGNNGDCAWVRRVGHALIDYVECTVGGSQVDKHYGTWYDLWYELTHTNEQERGYSKMIGDVSECTTLASSTSEYTLYIPLQFWFNRNTGLALPLIALQYHEVRFNIKFSAFADLVCYTGSQPSLPTANLSDTSILVDYIYLDQEERRRMAQVGHEYLIEQLQFGGQESVSAGSQQKVKLDFNHPCKEIVWAVRVGAFSGAKAYLAHYQTSEDQLLEDAAKNIAWGMIGTEDGSGTWTQVSTEVSGNDAIAAGSTGIVQFTEGNTTFTLVVDNQGSGNSSLTGLYVNGTDAVVNVSNVITEVTYNITLTNTGSTVGTINLSDVSVTKHTLTVAQVSKPVGDLTDNRSTNNNDVTVNQPFNYGLDLAGNGNPVRSAKLQLNGHDRFDEQDGSYFNYVQPAQHHTHTPADSVNVYSFGLNPEQHQPSGTANLSRIDTTLLHLTYSDSLSGKRGGNTVSVTADSLLWIFAFSYNVFRIMSGMGGLAYAN
jgi:hypothetical protein